MEPPEHAILYVPGMKPKPPADVHRANLWRCLLTGVGRVSRETADAMAADPDCFRLVPWPHLFYPEPADPAEDAPGLDRLLAQPGPDPRDVEEARHWQKRLARVIYLLSDAFPFLIDHVAVRRMKDTLADSLRYFEDQEGVGARIRGLVRDAMADALEGRRRLLVIAHSLGSVVAWDALWELSHREPGDLPVDLFLTLGSPLGLNFVRHRLLGADERGADRYPANIRAWRNLAAIGDLTSLDRTVADDFREMRRLGLVGRISDETRLVNWFRGPRGLNVHKCYAYMVNPHTAAAVADWWAGPGAAAPAS